MNKVKKSNQVEKLTTILISVPKKLREYNKAQFLAKIISKRHKVKEKISKSDNG